MNNAHALHARRLRALGHPLRLAALRAAVQGPRDGTPAGRIRAALRVPASTLSHHLEALASSGLLKRRREGTRLLYAARYDELKRLTDYLWEDCCQGGCPKGACR